MGESGQPDEAQFVAMVEEQFDEIRPAIDALLDEIDRFLGQLEEPLDVPSGRPPYRLIAAAGLRRCTRLTRAQLALIDSGFADIGGLPTRPALETFLVAAYVFLAGDEGLDRVRGAHVGQIKKFDDPTMKQAAQHLVENWDGPTNGITWEQFNREVRDLFVAATDPSAGPVFDHFYSVVYRGSSMTSIHGGVAAIEPYFDHDWRTASVVAPEARHHALGLSSTRITASLCGMLAPLLMRSFGWPEDRTVALTDRINAG
jgi:hypothetical protein